MVLHCSEVRSVSSREFHLAAQGDGGDLAIGQSAGAAARRVEEFGSFASISGKEWFGNGQQQLREQLVLRSQWAGKEFAPGNGTDCEVLAGGKPREQFRFLGGTRNEGLNEKVGVEVNHSRDSAASVTNEILPRRGFFRSELKAALQFAERLQALGVFNRSGSSLGLRHSAFHSFLFRHAPRARELVQYLCCVRIQFERDDVPVAVHAENVSPLECSGQRRVGLKKTSSGCVRLEDGLVLVAGRKPLCLWLCRRARILIGHWALIRQAPAR